jgi:hypothetical protein
LTAGAAAYALAALSCALAGAAVALAVRRAGAGGRDDLRPLVALMAGAAAGAVVVVPSLNALGPPSTLSFAAVAALLGAVRLGLPRRAPWAIMPILVVALLAPLIRPNEPNVAATKPLASFLDQVLYPDSELLDTRWDAVSRLDVFAAPGAQLLWHTPSRAREPLPDLRGIALDGEAVATAVGSIELGRAASLARRMPSSLPFAVSTRERVLVLGAGGGMDVEAALAYGARDVDVVERDRGVVQLLRGSLAGFTDDILRRRGVRLTVEDPRRFARAARSRGERYDAIVIGGTGSWGALTAGSYSLTPQTLYTREAFDDFYALLAEGGVMSVSEWYAQPPRELQRLVGLARVTVARAGGDAVRQVMLERSGQFGTLGTLVVRRGAFTPAEVGLAQTFARDNGYGIVYTPGDQSGDMAAILAGLDDGATDGRPLTDDRPFFFSHETLMGAALGRAPWPPPQAHAALAAALVTSTGLLVAALRARRGERSQGPVAPSVLIGAGIAACVGALVQRGAQLAGMGPLSGALTPGLMLCGVAAALVVTTARDRLAPAFAPSAWGFSWAGAALGAALGAGLAVELGYLGVGIASVLSLVVAVLLARRLSPAVGAEIGTVVPGGKSRSGGAAGRKMR